MAEEHAEQAQLTRVDKLVVTGFKHFEDRHAFEFGNADIVLLTGPNGAGKTSIVEALELATTGNIEVRIGQPKDSSDKLKTYLYCKAGDGGGEAPQATVTATWAPGLGAETARPETEVTIKKASAADGDPLLAEVEETEQKALRAQTFLYSESLGSILGVNDKARKLWLDAFIPARPALARLDVHSLEAERNRLLHHAQDQLRGVSTAARRFLEAAARLEGATGNGATPSLQLTKSGGEEWRADASKKLQNWLRSLGVDADLDDGDIEKVVPAPTVQSWAQALAARADAADEAERERATARSAEAARWTAVKQALEQATLQQLDRAPTADDVLERLEAPPSADALQHVVAAARLKSQQAEQAVRAVWHSAEVLDSQGRPHPLPVGTLPLLASWRHLLTHAPEAVERLGLPVGVAANHLDTLEAQERERRRLGQEQQLEAATQLAEATEAAHARACLTAQHAAITVLEASWKQAAAPEPIPTTDDGELDLAAIRERRQQESEGSPPTSTPEDASEPSGADLRVLAGLLDAWASAAEELAQARDAAEDATHWEAVQDRLDAAKAVLNVVADLDSKVRSQHISQQYQEPINRFLQRVLGSYAHRPRVQQHIYAHFDKVDALRLTVGAPGSKAKTRGLMSLSRSQYTSAMLALALATNLGQPDPKLGFICLDDVSDALDLDNLAADAQLFRQLAYGQKRRRQLILTNHNEEITDRLVPKLLPPAGRSMRIIQLQPPRGSGLITVRHWDVNGEARSAHVKPGFSPLMAMIP